MNRKRSVAMALAMVALAAVGVNSFGGRSDPVVQIVAQPALRMAAATPLAPSPAVPQPRAQAAAEPAPEAAAEPAADPVLAEAYDPCAISLEAFAEEGAMIGITLLAPCRADARVVLQHGGLAVAQKTLATGSLFTALPAMEAKGEIEARFDDGTVLKAAAPVPELAGLRRIAVQWQKADRFALNGFERGADYGEAGHKTALNGGVLALGDPSATPAMLAEVYTFPDPEDARVTIEAEVTPDVCGRELMGETILSQAGAAQVQDLTLAMPECDALGGFVVLNNPLADMTLAAAD
ncbi:hypothetical protein [Paragemmobacter straminiformis]|uniref:Translocase n=1 Tax=Paragemmobacter straminiformis TaxID=2045119 RepID=A0A842I9A5_9RHOB|nr:hypothetical protein [Gemmobacter straminiformis]MBC2836215.1 hypothetical protein [Gemmobacter straminiformis]